MTTTSEMKSILQPCVFSNSIMDTIISYLEGKGYSYQHDTPAEIVIKDCTKEKGKKIVEEATCIDRKSIKYGFQMVANRNNLYIRKKYKNQPFM